MPARSTRRAGEIDRGCCTLHHASCTSDSGKAVIDRKGCKTGDNAGATGRGPCTVEQFSSPIDRKEVRDGCVVPDARTRDRQTRSKIFHTRNNVWQARTNTCQTRSNIYQARGNAVGARCNVFVRRHNFSERRCNFFETGHERLGAERNSLDAHDDILRRAANFQRRTATFRRPATVSRERGRCRWGAKQVSEGALQPRQACLRLAEVVDWRMRALREHLEERHAVVDTDRGAARVERAVVGHGRNETLRQINAAERPERIPLRARGRPGRGSTSPKHTPTTAPRAEHPQEPYEKVESSGNKIALAGATPGSSFDSANASSSRRDRESNTRSGRCDRRWHRREQRGFEHRRATHRVSGSNHAGCRSCARPQRMRNAGEQSSPSCRARHEARPGWDRRPLPSGDWQCSGRSCRRCRRSRRRGARERRWRPRRRRQRMPS